MINFNSSQSLIETMYLNTERIFYIVRQIHLLFIANTQRVMLASFQIHSHFNKPYVVLSAIVQNTGDKSK